jgi:integrase
MSDAATTTDIGRGGVTMSRMTDLIHAHLAHIRAGGFAANTIEDRGKVLRRLNDELPMGLDRATVEELAGWLAHDAWTAQTRATYYGHLRGYFTWACDPLNPQLDYDPSASLIRPRVAPTVPRPTSDAEVAHALEHAADPWRRMVALAAYAGCRSFELAIIRREDVTPIQIIITGKGGKQRAVPTSPIVWRAVDGLPAGRLHPGRTADNISTNAGIYLRHLGLAGVTLHRYRHWFATTLLRNGADLRTVQELMGHSSPATTAIYTQVSDEQRRTAIAALPALAPTSA